MSPLCESYLPPTSSTRWSRSTRCTCGCATSASSCSSTSTSTAERHLHRVRLLLVVLDRWLKHAEDYVGDDHRAARARRRQLRRRAGQQRRLPAAVLRQARHPVPRASSRRPTSPRRRSRRACRPTCRSSATSKATSWPPSGKMADLVLGNNVLAQVPDLNDFVAGIPHHPEADGHRDHRVPAPDAAARGEPVRHDLPRALLLLLADQRRGDLRRRTA